MSLAVVSSKGQITLPAKVRNLLNIHPKDKVQFIVRDDEVVIKPLRSLRELRGSIPAKEGDSREAVQDAVSQHVVEGQRAIDIQAISKLSNRVKIKADRGGQPQ